MTVRKVPADQAVRDRLVAELSSSFVVEAAAGTGKTTVLVGRIVAVVRAGLARLGQVIAVTFTEKAAGEMKLRLREALERAREASSGVELARLTLAMEELEVARIGTIHGLCADLLREHPVEASVDPMFEVASEGDADAALHAVFTRWFQQTLGDPPEGVRRLLRRRAQASGQRAPRQLLLEALKSLVEHRDFDGRYRKDLFARDEAIDALVPQLQALGELGATVTGRPNKRSEFLEHLRELGRFVDDLKHREAVSPRDHDGLEAQLRELSFGWGWQSKPWGLKFEGGTGDQVAAQRDALHVSLEAFLGRADAHLAACLQAELLPVVQAYEAEKARTGQLDFVDLLLRTRDLLQQHDAVRQALQQRFTHLFVDEFQDTDPLQTEIVLLLSADDPTVREPFEVTPVPGKLFAVGDPKQSIYRFRRADIQLYERVKQHLQSRGAQQVFLSTSFRSTPGIQRAVNGAFSKVMTGGHQAQYVELQPWRESFEDQPSVVALSVPRPYNANGYVSKQAAERSVPDAVGAFIDYLVRRSGWTVVEGEARVPLQARHVCILFRRFRGYGGVDIPRQYAQALEARRVPHVLVGGRSFHAREEVMALRTALWAIERPDDELSVYATLKGPFFALTDDRLLVFRHAFRTLHPMRPYQTAECPEGAREVLVALEVLKALHKERNTRPVADTLQALLQATRAHAGVAFWHAGDQALANVLQLAELSRRHERRATSFRDVVEALQAEADEGESPEAPIVEEGTEGVRMMTVHTAKGLEFPVVILAEPTSNIAHRQPSRWVDAERKLWAEPLAGCAPAELNDHQAFVLERDREESLRVAYVAATRACDLLVVPAIADKKLQDTWTEVLAPSIYPSMADARSGTAAPGCPAFTGEAVLDRPGPAPFDAPNPGLHRAASGLNRVVWWAPSSLELDRAEVGGLQGHEALADDLLAVDSEQAWTQWQAGRARVLAAAAVPGRVTLTPHELELPERPSVRVTVEDTGVDRSARPRGKRFGALVHAVLAQAPLSATAAELTRLAAFEARMLRATEEEQSAAVTAAAAALVHPVLRAAASSPQVRRECPVVEALADGRLVEGTVDLAYLHQGAWRVVEFKTDEELEPHRAEYEAQTETYVRGIEAATGAPVSGVILRV